MAGNFAKPVTTDLYTDILTLIRENQTELAKMLDGSTASSIPTGAKRWNETNKRFEKYDGSTWTALVPDATTSASGLMSAADKTKVDALKTGSSTEKQTSVTDATAGRLLINAAFGLAGASAPTALSAAGALDAIAQTSVYAVSAANVATVGGPSGANGGVVFTIRYSSTFAVQHYMNVLGGVRSWSRQCNNSAWSAWVENLHTGNIAPTHIPEDTTHRWATDAEKTNWNAAKAHADSAHAPSNAQKNSDIKKAEIEAKLVGTISSHTHAAQVDCDTVDGYHAQTTPAADKIPVAGPDGKLGSGWISSVDAVGKDMGHNNIGSLCFAMYYLDTTAYPYQGIGPGATVSGSTLSPCCAGGAATDSVAYNPANTLWGTWRCLGIAYKTVGTARRVGTIFQRIA